MADQELNEKLAEWAGFEKKLAFESGKHKFYWYVSPGGEEADVQFTTSLDACFKWLVPKEIDYEKDDYQIEITWVTFCKNWCEVTYNWAYGEFGDHDRIHVESETPALALCKAIEQLIDRGSKDG